MADDMTRDMLTISDSDDRPLSRWVRADTLLPALDRLRDALGEGMDDPDVVPVDPADLIARAIDELQGERMRVDDLEAQVDLLMRDRPKRKTPADVARPFVTLELSVDGLEALQTVVRELERQVGRMGPS